MAEETKSDSTPGHKGLAESLLKPFEPLKGFKDLFDGNPDWLKQLNATQKNLHDRLKTIGALGVNLGNIPTYSSLYDLPNGAFKYDWLDSARANLSNFAAPSLSSEYRKDVESKISAVKNASVQDKNALLDAVKDLADVMRSGYDNQISRLVSEWQTYTLQMTGHFGAVVKKLEENVDASKAYLAIAKEQQSADAQKVLSAQKEASRNFKFAIFSLIIALVSVVVPIVISVHYGEKAHCDSCDTTTAITNAIYKVKCLPNGDFRNGAVCERSQFKNPQNDTRYKRDAKNGRIMDGKADGTRFKGVTREK